MILELPEELQKLILSFFSRKEYKATVPCKALLLCKSYLYSEDYCKLNSIPIVNLSSREKEKLFNDSCKYNNLRLVKWLLTQVNPSADNNDAIREASREGHKEIVEILLRDPRVDPSANNNWAIRLASENGHKEVVELLLMDKRVDPSDWDNYAIYWASEKGLKEIVEILLRDFRVDPSVNDNEAIRRAIKNKHYEIVQMILNHPKCNLPFKFTYCLRE